jgi:hypothetical protein
MSEQELYLHEDVRNYIVGKVNAFPGGCSNGRQDWLRTLGITGYCAYSPATFRIDGPTVLTSLGLKRALTGETYEERYGPSSPQTAAWRMLGGTGYAFTHMEVVTSTEEDDDGNEKTYYQLTVRSPSYLYEDNILDALHTIFGDPTFEVSLVERQGVGDESEPIFVETGYEPPTVNA